ncbi:MAG: type I secretion C-terminal target domain-containing protein [Aquabacterium sp.]|uniref:type I secretion C-terminal target domain-containing protein n=1 Tax=Aquabacterium sp. TaxID=1872578 RepID=UPI003BDA7103
MPTLTMSAGTVKAVWGQAFIRMPDGSLHPLHVGDKLKGGEHVLTNDDSIVEIQPLAVPTKAPVLVEDADKAIDALNAGVDEAAPEAGLFGGANGGLLPGLRVDRVMEGVTPLNYEFDTARTPSVVPQASGADQRLQGVSLDTPIDTPQPPAPAKPYLVIYGDDATEGSPVVFRVTLTEAHTDAVSVTLSLKPGMGSDADAPPATPGLDTSTQLEVLNPATNVWAPLTSALVFAPGVSELQVRVATIDDTTVEPVEYIRMEGTVTAGATQNTAAAAEAAIADNDPPYLVVYGEDTVEGGFAMFSVQLTQASYEAVTVSLRLQDGSNPLESATAGIDTTGSLEYLNPQTNTWEAVNGNLSFQPGQTEIQIRVATVDDVNAEGLEYIRLQADVVAGRTANTTAANEAAITDNDPPYLVVYGEDTVEGGYASFSVQLTQTSSDVVTVNLHLKDGTDPLESATAGVDTIGPLAYYNTATHAWEAVSGPLSFQPGETEILVRVATVEDALTEGLEYIGLQADVIAGTTVNPTASNQAAITDNEAPIVLPDVAAHVSALDTNLLVVLDVSNSMNNPSGIGTLTRMQAAIQAIGTLLDKYDEFGNVAVRLVIFSNDAAAQGDHWLTVADAKALLSTITTEDSTNYDHALAQAQAAFATDADKLSNAQNVAYFLSDGNPTLSSDAPLNNTFYPGKGFQSGNITQSTLGDGIDATEESGWIAFLQANHIKSYAIGMGTEVSDTYLSPIAYDAQASTNLDGVVVTDFAQLSSVLAGTTQDTAGGNLSIAGTLNPSSTFAADHVASLTIDGVTYAYNASVPQVSVTTALGGELVVNMQSGAYSYQAHGSGSGLESVAFQLADGAGNVASSSLQITVSHTQVHAGTATADTLSASSSPDVFMGGEGSDVFAWHLSDSSTAVDVIKDFKVGVAPTIGDVLDMRDLLQGENTAGGAGNLAQYLSFAVSGHDTVISVSTSGQVSTAVDQQIVLQNVDLASELALGSSASNGAIIQALLNNKQLLVDQA